MKLSDIKKTVKAMHIETLNYDSYTTTEKACFKHNTDITDEIFDELDKYVDDALFTVRKETDKDVDFQQFVFDYDKEKIYFEFKDEFGKTFLKELK